MTILLYPVRPGDHNPELQYSLRSVQRNLLIEDLQIVTVGYCPRWLEPDQHIAGNKMSTSPMNVWENIKVGCQELADETRVLVMNDDFFLLDPITSVVQVYRGTLAEHLTQLGGNSNNWWARSMRLTMDYLQAQGYDEPLSYDLHRPFWVDPQLMADVLGKVEADLDLSSGVPPQWRTVYGNMVAEPAHQVDDVRLRRGHPANMGSAWVSTSDETWRMHAPVITRFLREPSRWEK